MMAKKKSTKSTTKLTNAKKAAGRSSKAQTAKSQAGKSQAGGGQGSKATGSGVVTTIDEYIALFPAEVQGVLCEVREAIKVEAPDAEEIISYRMPAFRLHGILLYFAAFKKHIGLYPPVSGDAAIEKAIAPYAGPKGNLQFPLDAPMPLALIRRIAKLRVKQNVAKHSAKRSTKT